MKILFVDNFSTNFGVSEISAVLKQSGHQVELQNYKLSKWKGIDIYSKPEKYFSFRDISERAILKKPDIIGFSVFSANYMFYKNASEAISRRSNIPIVVGGVLPTLNPNLFMEKTCCNYLFRGEAEATITELIDKISIGKFHNVPNLVYRGEKGNLVYNDITSFVEDIDKLPFYDKDLYPDRNSDILRIFTSRGCVMSCAYCSAGQYSNLVVKRGGRMVRKRSVDRVIEEIKQALERRPYKEIYFYDDFFITTIKWMSEFAEKYKKEINLPYFCSAFPASLNREMASLLAKSRCKVISLGFQTANDEYKKNVLKRNETKVQVIKAMKHLEEYRIKSALDHIFNLPGETRDHIKESLDFYIENKVKSLTIYFLNYYPDSSFAKYAKENNFITSEQYSKIMNNEMLGEQSFKGTIIDEKKAKEQIQYALLFRLISWLPGEWVKWMFNNNIQKMFFTNKFFYYIVSVLTLLKLIGFNELPYVLKFSSSLSNTVRNKISVFLKPSREKTKKVL